MLCETLCERKPLSGHCPNVSKSHVHLPACGKVEHVGPLEGSSPWPGCSGGGSGIGD